MPVAVPVTEDEAFLFMLCVGSLPLFLMGINLVTGACFAAGPGSLQEGGHRTVAAVALLTAWQYWVYMYLHHLPRVAGCDEGWGCLVDTGSAYAALWQRVVQGSEARLAAYHVCMVLWLWSWVRAIRTDVVCPVRTKELADAGEDAGCVRSRQRAAGCRSCKEVGGGSVQGFDHYCPLVANAVGRANRKPFLLTLVYQLVTGYLLLGDGLPFAVATLGELPPAELAREPKHLQVLIGSVLSVHVNLVCLFLLSVQVVVLPLGISSNELWCLFPWVSKQYAHLEPRRPSLPSIRNVLRELGPVYLLPLPV